MDDETAARFADLESAVRNLQSQLAEALNPPRQGKVLSMAQAVHKYGWSRETLRRRATAGEIPGAVKRGGRWQFPA
jgi:GH24 family phage-related lysozyme (muramidase)